LKNKKTEENKRTEDLIREIGEIQRNMQKIDVGAQKAIKKTKNEAKKKNKRMQQMIRRRMLKLFVVFISRPNKTKKTLKFVNGRIGSFITPPAVNIRSIKNVLKSLKLKRLTRFIRTVIIEEIDKEAVLMAPRAVKDIKGISISQKERFEVTPAETSEAVLEDVKKLQKEMKND
jgi:phage host-nuclease inhibitor protein Gam